MFDTVGDRITYCRSLLNLTRNEMAKEIGSHISLPTLARWELNTVIPSSKKIDILAAFFANHGVNVSAEWLKHGKGCPPISSLLNEFDESQFDDLAYTTLLTINNKIRNFYFQQVTSNFFKPIISYGDYIGGIFQENHLALNNKLCFLCPSDFAAAGIYHHDEGILINLNGEKYKISMQNVKLGEVQWIIRRP